MFQYSINVTLSDPVSWTDPNMNTDDKFRFIMISYDYDINKICINGIGNIMYEKRLEYGNE